MVALKDYSKCIFCGGRLKYSRESRTLNHNCSCENCGDYRIALKALEDLPARLDGELKDRVYLISGYLREMTDRGLSAEIITTENYLGLLDSAFIPKTVMEKLNKFLLHLYRKTEFFQQWVKVRPDQPAVAYAKNKNELEHIISATYEEGYLRSGGSESSYSLNLSGITRAEKLLKGATDNRQCFVALWYEDSILQVYEEHIKRAVVDSGYQPLAILEKEHNNKICDEILDEIRRSRCVVADFSGHRGGVYFEAGFALGLGLPVIWTCREQDFDKDKVHFDVDHYNFIVWKHGEHLYERLKNRISATIPLPRS